MIEMIQSNKDLKVIIETSSKKHVAVTEFFEKYGPKTKSKAKTEVGHEYGIRTVISSKKTGNMPSLDEALEINMRREAPTHIHTNINYYYPESINSMLYRLSTNTGKKKLW